MEFRKIQFTGRSSYIISLPKKWVLENGLKQGDTVPLSVNPDGSITIHPGEPRSVSESKRLTISSEYSPDMAVRLVISVYIQGYDTLEIEFAEELPQYKVKIRKTLQNLPGVEILSEEPSRIVVKSFLDEEEIDLIEILSRLGSIVISMLEDLALMREFQDKALSRDINDLENELDRFYFLAIRAVNKAFSYRSSGGRGSFDLIGLLFIVRNVERIGDHILRISQNFDEELDIEELKHYFSEMMKQVERRDLKKIDRLMAELKDRIKSIDYRSSVSMDSYRRILEYLENIGETIINMSMS
ncbi:phosphate signaling complex PhoU family protein [Palaeococcus ferrophilus]|uniref:phosphate signaling complex PhoU family protein n=1 Tax=Palaeococcus ferrophilus TaxID=83868 RepID=UPI00064F8802|nr:phosphate uptake regulator PhoU [Palaeococcus ferrophilus]